MRRSGVAGAIAVSAALLLAACGGSSSSDAGSAAAGSTLDPKADLTKQTLTVSNWAGYYPEDLPAKFQTAVGAPLTIANHATNEEIMGKLTAGGDSGIDVAFVSGQYAQALNDAGLLEPMDPALIPNLKNLYPEATQMPFDKGNKFSVPYTWGTTGICYRSDLVTTEPTSWNDILKPADENKGKVTMLSTERWLLLPARKSLGYSINTTNADELAAAKDLTLAQKPDLLAYDDTTFYTRLVSGEATMVEAWDGWCNYGIAEDPNIKFVVPKEGSDLWSDTMVVLKSSKNKEAGMAFINYILDPANHAWVAENILYKVPNKAAMETEAVAGMSAAYPNMGMTPAELLKEEAIVDLGEQSSAYTKIATEVTSG
ncbi:MAG: spermidine/putrescine ABC transporter substrate-binding protein [Actinobacteria bacterium]|nr:spermidine/putrescine ABC transporter substrate-binding protein [Actinomycetota bacterium]